MVCAVGTSLCYYLLVYTTVLRDRVIYEGWYFFLHVVLAFLGIPLAIIGSRRRLRIALPVLVICSYFLFIQMGLGRYS